MAEVLFVLNEPCPRETPVLDSMWRRGIDLMAVYHIPGDQHGWGDMAAAHPHESVPPGRLRSCLFVGRSVTRRDVRVLCCFGYNKPANILAVLLARLRGIPVVTRSDTNWLQEVRRSRSHLLLKSWTLRRLYGRRTRIWTSGVNNDRYWREMGFTNLHPIPYRLPHPPAGSAAEGREFRKTYRLGSGMVVVYVGMLEPHKGIGVLLDAFRDLPTPSVRLVVVGRGSLADAVTEAAAKDPRIVFPGSLTQRELGPVFAAADVLVLPSWREAWGHVVEEALANGVRVAVTDVVGCAAELVNASNGWLFPPGRPDVLTKVLLDAAVQRESGWPTLELLPPYDAAPATMEELIRLGARVGRTQGPQQRDPAARAGAASA